MSCDYVKSFKLEVEIQENGIIRDPFGWIIGRCDDDWLKLVTRHEMEPNGLTVSNDGELINWRGENYVRQHVDYLCDLCRHSEYIASNTRLKCHGESGAIVAIKTIDYGKNDPLEICRYFEPKEVRDD